jgi:UDP-3-O-[3-hydroxymyristoyl] N-acetylglucosamine deacetylase
VDNSCFRTRQATIRSPLTCAGIGLHSGAPAAVSLLPAEPDTGIVFRRTDITSETAYVEARHGNIHTTVLGTTLRNASGVTIATVEHLMAALIGLGVDNVAVEVNGPEIPIMDGSAQPFVTLIDRAGLEFFAVPRKAIRVLKRVEVAEAAKRASLAPGDGFAVAFEIEFPSPVIGRQSIDIEIAPSTFRREVAPARTFGFLEEVEHLRKRGLALGGSLDNAIVIGDGRVLNEGPLRFADEFVRHKVLDAIGDLALAGAPLLGRYEGVRAGHEINHSLLKAMFADPTAWCLETAQVEPAPAAGVGALAAAGF